MLPWFIQNLATILIGGVVLGMVVFIIVRLVRDRKKGKSACGCSCSNCPMGGSCHPKT